MWIVGHRGALSPGPENTLRAINAGLICADYIEVDVRLSHEGVPVVIHDARLDRTTSGTGQVNDLTLKELKELDAGEGERIPTLKEVVPVILHSGRGIFIEIKEPGSEDIICKLIRNFISEKVIVVSFHTESLLISETRLPGLKTGIIVPNIPNHHQIQDAWFKFDLILPRLDYVCTEFVEQAHTSGTRVIPWLLNSRGELKKAIRMGVDGVITDDPCTSMSIIRSLR